MDYNKMKKTITSSKGFIAALDQSGGSTPSTLSNYGINHLGADDGLSMYDHAHNLRTRIMTNPLFNRNSIAGTILFEETLDREVEGMSVTEYLWKAKGIVPFLKIDNGLNEKQFGVQLLKPIPTLHNRLDKAVVNGVYGTKARSVIHHQDAEGISRIVSQQFELADKVRSYGLVHIVEPEVSITMKNKQEAEYVLLEFLLGALNDLDEGEEVILKLTLPEIPNHYLPLVNHPRVLKVVALSGGYRRSVANRKLSDNNGMSASFSRALLEGLKAKHNSSEFTAVLSKSVDSIYNASNT